MAVRITKRASTGKARTRLAGWNRLVAGARTQARVAVEPECCATASKAEPAPPRGDCLQAAGDTPLERWYSATTAHAPSFALRGFQSAGKSEGTNPASPRQSTRRCAAFHYVLIKRPGHPVKSLSKDRLSS